MAAVDYSAGKPDEGRVILCTYCDQPQAVGRKAKTITCRHCYKRLDLEDANIKHYDARRALETCGTILVDKSGTVVAAKVHCAALSPGPRSVPIPGCPTPAFEPSADRCRAQNSSLPVAAAAGWSRRWPVASNR